MTAAAAMEGDVVSRQFGAFVPGESVRVGPTDSGPLDGMTFAVKDLIDIAGYTTGGGNPDWRATHAPATTMAPAPAALLAAGATLSARRSPMNSPSASKGANAHYGTPVNPAAPDRLPGGSSSGSAVAVAAGLCDTALGTDTGGSVRIPASFCGIYGIRPTHGRVSTEGVISFGKSFDTVGWFARDAATLRQVGSVLLEPRRNLPIERLLVATDIVDLADARSRRGDEGGRSIHGRSPARSTFLETKARISSKPFASSRARRSGNRWAAGSRPSTHASARRSPSVSPVPNLITADAVARWQPFRAAFRDRMAALLPPGVGIVFPTSPILRAAEVDLERGARRLLCQGVDGKCRRRPCRPAASEPAARRGGRIAGRHLGSCRPRTGRGAA